MDNTLEHKANMVTRWHLVVAKRLATAEASLKRLGHIVYYPQEKISITRLNKRFKIMRPLLYRYLFLGIEPGSSYYRIRTSNGVLKLMEDMSGDPAHIRKKDVERFKRNEMYGMYDKTRGRRGRGPLRKGTMVQVIEGPFEHWKGPIQRCGLVRARVLLGDSMVIEFPLEILVTVE